MSCSTAMKQANDPVMNRQRMRMPLLRQGSSRFHHDSRKLCFFILFCFDLDPCWVPQTAALLHQGGEFFACASIIV